MCASSPELRHLLFYCVLYKIDILKMRGHCCDVACVKGYSRLHLKRYGGGGVTGKFSDPSLLHNIFFRRTPPPSLFIFFWRIPPPYVFFSGAPLTYNFRVYF